jgi:fucose 4-O-acetylase-like acetyltransferase
MENSAMDAKIVNRSMYLDLAKGVGILLVVLGHMKLPIYIIKIIYSFHMPLFFFLSGYIYSFGYQKDMLPFIKRKFFTLVVPYIFFSLVAYLIYFGINVSKEDIVLSFFSGHSVNQNLAIWFLIHLFILQVFIHMFIKWIHQKIHHIWMVLIIAASIGLISSLYHWKLYFHIEILGISSFFYLFGFMTAKYLMLSFKKLVDYIKKNLGYVYFFLLFALLSLNLPINIGHSDLNSNYLINPFTFYFVALIGIGNVFLFATFLQNKYLIDFFIFLGKNSLIILCVHQLVPIFLKQIYAYFNLTCVDLMHKLLVVFVIYFLIKIINNYFKFIIGANQKI